MFVKLVVINKGKHYKECHDANIMEFISGNYLSGNDALITDHYPYIDNTEKNCDLKYLSTPYLCSMVIGTTNWSGWSKKEERYWTCSIKDLNSEGIKLYRMLKSFYKGCKIELLTFIDT